jgi:hypothetical protein
MGRFREQGGRVAVAARALALLCVVGVFWMMPGGASAAPVDPDDEAVPARLQAAPDHGVLHGGEFGRTFQATAPGATLPGFSGFAAQLFAAGAATAEAVEQAASEVQVPVPAAIWLLGSGLGVLGFAARRRITTWRRHRGGRATAGADSPALHRVRRAAELRDRIRRGAFRSTQGCRGGRSGGSPEDPAGSGVAGCAAPQSADGIERRFQDLADALLEQPNVVLGRRFGRDCVKLGKRVVLVRDHERLAFRVGTEAAAQLASALPRACYWNPKQGHQPKRSWLAHPAEDAEALVALTAAAYEYALSGVDAEEAGAESGARCARTEERSVANV